MRTVLAVRAKFYNEEHNPQGLTPKFNNLNQTALTPVGVDAFVRRAVNYD